jgi:hypothetical protein
MVKSRYVPDASVGSCNAIAGNQCSCRARARRCQAIRHQKLAQAGDNAIVFIGDSITESALLPETICGHQVVNAGLGGAPVTNVRNVSQP